MKLAMYFFHFRTTLCNFILARMEAVCIGTTLRYSV